ncbi:MAG: hypothetical protein IIB29_09515 [Chloroflexi bacterium]|nr:hypothetical protein [Chloroflexota bacterium]
MAVVTVIVAAIGVTVTFLNRSAELPLLPQGTPEGTVHRFLLAVERGDNRQAYDYLDSELQETCTYQHFRDSTRLFEAKGDRYAGDLRVTLEGTESVDGAVEVRVRITRFRVSPPSPFSPPFDGGESSHGERFTLEMTDGDWLFVDPPWPMNRCPEAGAEPSPGGRPRRAPR